MPGRVATFLMALVALGLHAEVAHAQTATAPPRLAMLRQVVTRVQRDYLFVERLAPKKLLAGALRAMANDTTEVLVAEHRAAFVVTAGASKRRCVISARMTLEDVVVQLESIVAFAQARLGGAVSAKDLEMAAISGLVAELDPHSKFLTPNEFRELFGHDRRSPCLGMPLPPGRVCV